MKSNGKLGTFGGVFTPSILTILGVIMYLRLPSIVGQAGLWQTISIILVAHIISITTGLSVASIATDKKVKAGGPYYMISRSFGLPIGGTLGLALFVGLSFSVSLYAIGFSESILSFLGIEITKNTIRVAGSITLVVVTIVTFVSTNLAIKAQYFIMLAIILSLISIFLGVHSHVPTEPMFRPASTASPYIVLFGIFFPAVTGFTAGVSMSGDLKDPKKSIPLGTIAAISAGLLTYIVLTTFLAFRVDPRELVSNPKILLDISLIPSLVIAGIWGATISSAFGGLLGAPRILQATSNDRITPRFFAKGYGNDNEPRHALFMTFLIALGGILVGELDVIARVVSMFFITTYGFLNLSCAAESWASPDFRPEFRIPASVSILGFITCLVVMIQLDFLAMIGAILILGLIFFYLERKELALESGDTWEGIWSSIIRLGLHRLGHSEGHQRNWRPNAILFSGGSALRPHLIEFGRWLVDKRGVLSDFILIESESPKLKLRKSDQAVREKDDNEVGIFSRRLECTDIYDCMAAVTRYYGFSGIEPNTVLLGWARNSKNPRKFVKLLRHISALDYNVLLLDYDDLRGGFGNHKTIDIWWRGTGNSIALALAIIRFLSSTHAWRQAEIRIILVNEESSITELIHSNMNQILDDYRVNASVKVIDNAVDKKPFHELIKLESMNTDLTITGIPDIDLNEAENYVEKTNSIIDEIGTVLLIKASSFFKDVYVGIKIMVPELAMKTAKIDSELGKLLPALRLPDKVRLSNPLTRFNRDMEHMNLTWYEKYAEDLYRLNLSVIKNLAEFAQRGFGYLEKNLSTNNPLRNRKILIRVLGDFLFKVNGIVDDYLTNRLPRQKQILDDSLTWLFSEQKNLTSSLPSTIHLFYDRSEFAIAAGDSISRKQFKIKKRLYTRLLRRPISADVEFKACVEAHLGKDYRQILLKLLHEFRLNSYHTVVDFRNLVDVGFNAFRTIDRQLILEGTNLEKEIKLELEKLSSSINQLIDTHRQQRVDCRQSFMVRTRGIIQDVCDDLAQIDANRVLQKRKRQIKQSDEKNERTLETFVDSWHREQSNLFNVAKLDTTLVSFRHRLRTIVTRALDSIKLSFHNEITEKLNSAIQCFEEILEKDDVKPKSLEASLHAYDFKFEFDVRESIDDLDSEIRKALHDLPEKVETLSNETMTEFTKNQFYDLQIVVISLRRLVEYVIQTELIGPIKREIDKVPDEIQRASSAVQDVIQVVALSKFDPDVLSDLDYGIAEDPNPVLEKGLGRLKKEHQDIAQTTHDFFSFVEDQLTKTTEKLNPYHVTYTAGSYEHYIQRSHEIRTTLITTKNRFSKFMGDQMIKSMFRLSENLLSAKQHSKNLSNGQATNRIFSLVESFSINHNVQKELPFHYHQLFLSKYLITKELWIGRQHQFALADEVVNRFRRGYSGGLLITGEADSGKTILSHFIAHRFFDKSKIYTINPIEGGSIQISDFKQSLENSLQSHGDFDEIFEFIPQDSAIVLNDLELWWERNADGADVINLILDLIDRFSRRCLFIINVNSYTLHFMQMVRKIDDYFLMFIDCCPFSTRELRDIIMLRHHSTGLKYQLDDEGEERVSKWKQAKLFSAIYECARGNVGVALQIWISLIQNVSNDRVTITIPKDEPYGLLDSLTSDQLVVLTQFILHKQLSLNRLIRLMDMDSQSITHEVNALKRAGLIVEKRRSVLEIDRFVQPVLTREMTEYGVLKK